MTVGGIGSGPGSISVSPGSDDFALYIDGFLSGTPTLNRFFYTQLAAGTRYFQTIGQGTVSVVDPNEAVSGTPLPGTLPLFASGLGALGLFGLKRKRKAAARPAASV